MRNNIAKFVISLSIGLSLLILTFRYFDLDMTLSAIKESRIDYLIAAFGLLITAYLLRGRRWMIWEPGLKYWDSFMIILVGFMGNNILPARLGELLRAHCAAANIKNEFGRTATLASIAIERILDGFIIAVFGITGLLIVPLGTRLSLALSLVCFLFFMLTVGLILGNCYHIKIRSLLDRIHDIFPGHLTGFGREKINFFLDGLLLIRKPGTMVAAILMTFFIWGVELISYYLIAKAVFDGFQFNISLIFLPVVNFASLFPFTVGGLGAIEGATTPFLINAGLPFNESLAMVLIQHSFQFFFTTLAGGIFFFTNRYYDIPLMRVPRKSVTTEDFLSSKNSTVLQDTRQHLDKLTTDLGFSRFQKPKIELSIVIPAYNEENRLPKTILETIRWCKRFCPNYEIIVVDDGSIDETLEISRLFMEYDENVKVVANPHLGKGAAVRSGMLNAAGNHVLFMDADGATPLDQIPKLRAKLAEGNSVAIGSRIIHKPGETTVVTSHHRRIIGRTFAAIVNIFGVSGIGDTQCGFKMFRGEKVKEIFSRQRLNGFAFDVEILYLSRKLSLQIAEVPVNWENKEGSKVNLVFDSVKMLRDVLKLKMLHRNL